MKQGDIDNIRSFNRFYTGFLGLLDRHLLNSNFTLLEVRILFEISNNQHITAREIATLLHIDKGYLSRTIKSLEKKKLISKKRSPNDARNSHLELTARGTKEFELLNQAATNQIKTVTTHLSKQECDELVSSMNSIRNILNRPQT